MKAQVQPNSGYGASYGEWAARWWEWILSIPAAQNPVVDSTGANCKIGQVGSVWFLAGTLGGTAERACAVPAGKPVFFPIITNVAFAPTGNETILDLRQLAAGLIDPVTELRCFLDGLPCAPDLLALRAQSPVFATIVRTASLLPPKFYHPMVTDGYWLLLAPLRPGQHKLEFGATTPDFFVAVTYNLTVQ
jgi:hypothetical protein